MNEETIVYIVQLINELMRGGPHRVAVCLYYARENEWGNNSLYSAVD